MSTLIATMLGHRVDPKTNSVVRSLRRLVPTQFPAKDQTIIAVLDGNFCRPIQVIQVTVLPFDFMSGVPNAQVPVDTHLLNRLTRKDGDCLIQELPFKPGVAHVVPNEGDGNPA